MPDVICLGEVIVDMIAMDKDAGLEHTRGFYKFPGGATANVAVGICRMGRESAFLGALAQDPFGRFLENSLQKEGVDVSHMKKRPGERTVFGFIAVKSDQTKDVMFYRDFESEMFLSSEEIDPEFIAKARIFHFGIICLRTDFKRDTTLKALKIARDAGLFISLDTNYRPHAWPSRDMAFERFSQVLDYVDLLKIADEEWPLLFGREPDEEGFQDVLNRGIRVLIISHGPGGATLITPRVHETVPGFRVEAEETTGAGDAFTAATLVELAGCLRAGTTIDALSPEKWQAVIRRSNAAGALACTKPGAIPAIPTAREIDDFLTSYGSFTDP